MNEVNVFEIATREKLRFPYKGSISVEDLWDLSPANLDSVFKSLNAEKKQAETESLLSAKTDADTILDIKLSVVRHIVAVKLAEAEKRAKAKEIKEQKQKIMEIIANKQDAALQNKSVEELQAMLAGLE